MEPDRRVAIKLQAPTPEPDPITIPEGFDLNTLTPGQLESVNAQSFAFWAARSGIEVDNHTLEFSTHSYLVPIYECDASEIVVMKAAQMGVTIWLLLRLLWWCRYRTVKACLYFPTGDALVKLSKDRLRPLIKSNPDLAASIDPDETHSLKQMGRSSLYMQHLGGLATKDSTPFDVLAFDEVRLMEQADVEQALERISHSAFKVKMFVSTAGNPGADIHARFLRGTQKYWHTRCSPDCLCPDCGRPGIVLSDVWPKCIVERDGEVSLRCPRCGYRIHDAQVGQYEAHNPGAKVESFHIHQMLSKHIELSEIWRAYVENKNLKEFFNSKLGRPYIDEEARPITMEDLLACENPEVQWAENTEERSDNRVNCCLGADQASGNCHITIGRRWGAKKRIVHWETVESDNPRYMVNGKVTSPFHRIRELIKLYDVDLAVIDALPNVNEAQELAREFPGRIFLAFYIDTIKDMVQWADRPKFKPQVRKGGPMIRFKHVVYLDRYQTMDFSFREIAERHVEWGDPGELVQVVRGRSGHFEPEAIVRTQVYPMLQALVREKHVVDEVTGKFRMVWAKYGEDHYAHSFNYCNIALERARKRPAFVFV